MLIQSDAICTFIQELQTLLFYYFADEITCRVLKQFINIPSKKHEGNTVTSKKNRCTTGKLLVTNADAVADRIEIKRSVVGKRQTPKFIYYIL